MSGEHPAFFGLQRPTMADALVAIGRTHKAAAPAVWAQLLATAGLAGHETDDDALYRLLDAMTDRDPLSHVAARGVRIRINAHTSLAAMHQHLATTASPT